MYTVVVVILTSALILAYIATLYRGCRGKQFGFIIVLIVLLILSNIGYMVTTIQDHKAAYLYHEHVVSKSGKFDIESYIEIL